ncbi:MAG: S1 RNA-binding domain-containing protein [Prevotellaceae bacterium]|nr:S1 RNA-binding domain-containing protein [Prevotellaceae bacterium]
MDSAQIYHGYVSFFHQNKNFGFIECDDGTSYYFFSDVKELIKRSKELRKLKQSKLRVKFFENDEVNFKIRTLNGKIEVYEVEYLGNTKKEQIITESEENHILYGYLKQIEDKFFVKHISTYVFIPLKISEFEIDIDSVYTQRLNQLVQFKLEQVKNIDKLSAILVDRKFNANWIEIKEAFDTQETVTGYVKEKIKKGMIVEIKGFDAFLPISQIGIKPIDGYDSFIGKNMDFKIIKYDEDILNIILSHKTIAKSQIEELRKQTMSQIEKGKILEGIVKNIKEYGVFIDLGGVDGLIHISDLSWEKVSRPIEIVTLGQKLKIVVLDFDDEKQRISLGLKQLIPPPSA